MQAFRSRHGVVEAVDRVSFSLSAHETLAIVGESGGCGKSITALSLMRLVPDPPGRIAGGSVKLGGVDLLKLDDEAMRRATAGTSPLIFPVVTSLNPVLVVGMNRGDAVAARGHRPKRGRRQAVDMLNLAPAFPSLSSAPRNIRISSPAACASAP